jgi:hypothetical protein
MKRSTITQAGVPKLSMASDSFHDQTQGNKRQQRPMSTATLPSWTKYIDSRMRQFSAGR